MFSKKEIDKYREPFNDIKNYRYLSASEIKEARKNLNKLKKGLRFKKFHSDVDSVDYDDLDDYDDDDFADDDDEYRRIGSMRRIFDEDYYKPIRADGSFSGNRNSYIVYTIREYRYENLSPEEYLNMIRPYLRDLTNGHKPTSELTDETYNGNDERRECKIQLVMHNNCISTKHFEDNRTISASKPAEIFIGTDKDSAIDTLFDTTLQRFQQAIET